MVPVCSSVMLELVLAVHSYHVIAYPDIILVRVEFNTGVLVQRTLVSTLLRVTGVI